MNLPLLRNADLRALETRHARARPSLMERAGCAAATWVLERHGRGRVLICAGPGNNGGDGFVMARELAHAGAPVSVLFAAEPSRLPPDAAAAYQSCRATSADFCTEVPPGNFSLVVDALFGIGLTRPIEGDYARLIERINAFGGPILALDVPSGIDGDTGRVLGVAVKATHTLSFIGAKPGLYTLDGPEHCGELSTSDLGLDLAGLSGALVSTDDFGACLRARRRNSHKGSYGSLAVIGGAPGMTGAALLAARAGLMLGAGRVHVGLLAPLALDPVHAELMLRTPGDAITHATALAIGPGLGTNPEAVDLVRRAASADFPVLFDADALNLLAAHPVLARTLSRRQAPSLLTPHPAEAARLLAIGTDAVQADRVAAAQELATRLNATVVLKGCGTVIAFPDGRWRVNASGNPGLATAGSGDVLSGIAGALLAQGWPVEPAACGAVHLHGLAAERLVREGVGPVGMCAGELIGAARQELNRLIGAHA